MIPFIGIEVIRAELRLRFKSTERQQTLVYSRILRVILTNVTKSVLQDAYALSSVTGLYTECDKLYAQCLVVSITLEAKLNQSFPDFLFETLQVLQRTLRKEKIA